MQKENSTITFYSKNLHDFQQQLFLGFISEQPLEKQQYQISYIGGSPLWLYEPNQKLLICSNQSCINQTQYLTFIGQIFCPLDANHCYNRIFYILYCEKCKRHYKCLKQQTYRNWQPKNIILKKKTKQISQKSYEIESDPMQRKQLLKIINRAKIEVEEEIILQQEGQDDDDEEGEEVINVEKLTGQDYQKKINEFENQKKQRNYSDKQIEEINKKFEQLKMNEKDEKQGEKQIKNEKTDESFEQYRRIIKNLCNPIMLYSNIAIPYNKTPLNPKHKCKFCGMKLELEVQITQKLLGIHKNKVLVLLDWGSLFIYACTGSCSQSVQESIIVQYEIDAISQEEINKLKKTKKTRKNNKKKSLSKLRQRNESKDKNIQPEKIKFSQKQDQEEGDWD